MAVNDGGDTVTRTALLIDDYGNIYVDETPGAGLVFRLGQVDRCRSSRPMPYNPQLLTLPSIRPRRGGTLTQNARSMTTNLNGVSEVGTPLEVAQTSDGRQQLAKLTTKGNLIAGSDNILTVSIKNNSTESRTILLGDANTLINEERNIGPLASDVEVGGTFGTRTHPQIQLQSGNNPMELSTLHMLVTDEKFFSQGSIRYIKAKPTGNLTVNTISMAGRINENQQQTNVLRKDDFICTLDGFSAIEIVVPGGVTVDLTTVITGSSEAYSMVDL